MPRKAAVAAQGCGVAVQPGKILEVVKREAQLLAVNGVQRGQRLRAGAENPSRRGRQTRGAAKCRASAVQNLALLANGFSGVSDCERGLKILHVEVVKREAQLSAAQGCRAQTLALLANGFSGVSGCEPGLKILHAEVVKREAQLQNLALLTRKGLATNQG